MRNKYKLENFQRTVIKNKFVLSTGLNSSANFLSNDFQFPEEISRDFYRKPEKGELKNTMKGTITEPRSVNPFYWAYCSHTFWARDLLGSTWAHKNTGLYPTRPLISPVGD